MALDYKLYPLLVPKVVAAASTVFNPVMDFPDSVNLPGEKLDYGGDITSGKKLNLHRHKPAFSSPVPTINRDHMPEKVSLNSYGHDLLTGHMCDKAGCRPSVGATPEMLKPKMRELLNIFAKGDVTRMATRLFDKFLAGPDQLIRYFDDTALDAAAAQHPNIAFFCEAALSAPNLRTAGGIRIHQALKNAGWDIDKIKVPRDLGVPAFNQGNWFCEYLVPTKKLSHDCSLGLAVGDYNNGLGLMVNGIQHAYVVATHYHYEPAANQYCIGLKYFFYDVFGLDDTDLTRFGADKSTSSDTAAVGITAWWQLQHEHGYTPLVTRMTVEKSYVVDTN